MLSALKVMASLCTVVCAVGERSLRPGAQGVECRRWGARTVAEEERQGRQLGFQQLSPVEALQGLGQASAFISPT